MVIKVLYLVVKSLTEEINAAPKFRFPGITETLPGVE